MLKDVIKDARLGKNLTQEQIASLVKVAKQTYIKWESGETEPKASQIRLLAQHLELTADEICNGQRHQKMPLEKFIYTIAKTPHYRELEMLATWKLVPDHERYISELSMDDGSDEFIAREVAETEDNVNTHLKHGVTIE